MSTAPAPVSFLGEDLYVPTFKVMLLGQPLASNVVHDITSVTYKDNIAEIDSFEITISNWDDASATYQNIRQRKFKYSDQDLFDPGKRIELWMGYYGSTNKNMRKMLTGEITSIRPAFPASGQPTMVVGGLNILHTLRREPVSAAYVRKTDSEIASQIAQRLNVDFTPAPSASSEERYAYLVQDNQLDIVFLMDRARRIGYDLFVEEPTVKGQKPRLHFQPSLTSRTPTYQLNYGSTLLDFQPNLTTAKQVGEVTVRGWDAVHKQKIEETVTRKDLNMQIESSIESSFNQRKEVLATVPIRTKEEAKQLAKQTLTNISKDMIKGTGSTLGLPDLRSGNRLELGGLGTRFSKKYFVTATTHSISDSGYITQFECRMEEQGG